MSDERADVRATAERFGLSEAAGRVLFDALVAGGGRQAQFSHPELGGLGQWSGGMTQIGDMFNNELKARVSGFCAALSDAAAAVRSDRPGAPAGQWQCRGVGVSRTSGASTSPWAVPGPDWWPSHLGTPASSGAQNAMRYACFPDQHRLAVDRDGIVTLYDTGEHRLTGFAQQQSVSGHLSFSGQHGPVSIDRLRVVDR